MKTTLWAQITANGRYPHAGGDYPARNEVYANFFACCKAAGNVIFGRKTFDEFNSVGLNTYFEGIDVVLVTRHPVEVLGATCVGSPKAAVEFLESKGHRTALVGGGETILNSFLADGIGDELFFTVSPELGGPGPSIEMPEGQRKKLKLIEAKEIGAGTVRLHYALKD